jgi:hypothetical protein
VNYQKHYDSLIERARLRKFDAKTESHHIIPRCMGGSNAKSNRVDLTPEEHFVAHQLLVKLYPHIKGLVKAAAMMVTNRSVNRTKNKTYGWLRRLHYEARVGVPCSPETRAKLSIKHKTSEAAKAARAKLAAAQVGRKRSEASLKKMSESKKGVPLSLEARKKMSEAQKGREFSQEWRAKLSASAIGKRNSLGAVRSLETREKIRAAKVGKKLTPEQIEKRWTIKTPEERSAILRKGWETRRAKAALNQNANMEVNFV